MVQADGAVGRGRRAEVLEVGAHTVGKLGAEPLVKPLYVGNLFHDLHAAGTTLVMVTHNPQYEPEYDRVIYLRNGRKWRVVDNINHKTEEFET